MEIAELMRAVPKDHFSCSICGNILFEVEQVSNKKVRLTCENCGQCHLLIAISNDQIKIKFCNENRNKLNFN